MRKPAYRYDWNDKKWHQKLSLAPKPEPNQEMIEELKEIIKEMESGDVVSMCCALGYQDGKTNNLICVGKNQNINIMIGSVRILERDMIDCMAYLRYDPKDLYL